MSDEELVLEITVEETEIWWEYGDSCGGCELMGPTSKEINDYLKRVMNYKEHRHAPVRVNGEDA